MRSWINRLSKKALVAILILDFILPSAGFQSANADTGIDESKALKVLAKIEHVNDPILQSVQMLQKRYNDMQGNPKRFLKIVDSSMISTYSHVSRLHDLLEEGIKDARIGERAKKSYVLVIYSYFSYVELMRTIQTTIENYGGTSSITSTDLDQLSLDAQADNARILGEFFSQKAMEGGHMPFDLAYNMTEILEEDGTDTGFRRIQLTGPELHLVRLNAYMANPNTKTAQDHIRHEAARMIFARQADMSTLLYQDQKIQFDPPEDTGLLALQNHSQVLVHESMVRRYLTSALSGLMARLLKESRHDFELHASLFFEDVEVQLEDSIDQKRYENCGKTSIGLSKYFLDAENENLQNWIASAFENTQYKLTQISPSEFLNVLLDTLKLTYGQTIDQFLSLCFFDERKLSDYDQFWLLERTQVLMDETFELNANSPTVKKLLARFEKLRHNHDAITSMKRYALAEDLLQKSSALKWIEKEVTKLPDRNEINGVSFTLKPRMTISTPLNSTFEPHTGMVILAASRAQLPNFPHHDLLVPSVMEILQSQSSRVTGFDEETNRAIFTGNSRARDKADKNRVSAVLITGATHRTLLKYAQLVQDLATRKVRAQIQESQNRLIHNNRDFMSRSFRGKLNALYQSTHGPAQTVIGALRKMLVLARHNGMSTIEAQLNQVFGEISFDFERMMNERVKEGWEGLGKTLAEAFSWNLEHTGGVFTNKNLRTQTIHALGNGYHGKAVLQLKDELKKGEEFFSKVGSSALRKIFAEKNERLPYLRKVLSDELVWKEYLAILVQQIKEQTPQLFMKLRLPEDLEAETGVDFPVRLQDLIIGARESIRGLHADHELVRKPLKRTKASVLRSRSAMNKPLSTRLRPRDIIVSAVSGKIKKSNAWDWFYTSGVFLHDLGMDYVGTLGFMERFVESRGQCETDEPGNAEFWPESFYLRDVVPAALDGMKGHAGQLAKAEKAVVSSLIQPYLTCAVHATKQEQDRVLHAPWESIESVMVSSEAMRMAMSQAGDELGGQYEKLVDDANYWVNYWQTLKEIMIPWHEASHYTFISTFLTDMTGREHTFTGRFMFLVMVPDLISDMISWNIYAHQYYRMAPFVQGGAFGNPLVDADHADQTYQQMLDMGYALLERVPMDFIFAIGMLDGLAHGLRSRRESRKTLARIDRLKNPTTGEPLTKMERKEFVRAMELLNGQFQHLELTKQDMKDLGMYREELTLGPNGQPIKVPRMERPTFRNFETFYQRYRSKLPKDPKNWDQKQRVKMAKLEHARKVAKRLNASHGEFYERYKVVAEKDQMAEHQEKLKEAEAKKEKKAKRRKQREDARAYVEGRPEDADSPNE